MAPPADSTDAVVVKDHPVFGRSAFAARDIKAGELVTCEPALLRYEADDKVLMGLMKQVAAHIKAHPEEAGDATGIDPRDWNSACGFYLDFCRAPPDVQDAVLGDMFAAPEGDGVDGTAPVRRSAAQARVLAALAPGVDKILAILAAVAASGAAAGAVPPPPPRPAPTDAAVVQRVLLAAELNVHQFMARGGVMFRVASKLAHTCAKPNTYYKSHEGKGCNVALQVGRAARRRGAAARPRVPAPRPPARPALTGTRPRRRAPQDIAAGELLTTSYLPSDLQVMGRSGRQAYLWDAFSFRCACPRCADEPDHLAAIPCMACAPEAARRTERGHLPEAVVNCPNFETPPVGLLVFHPARADPAAPARRSALDALDLAEHRRRHAAHAHAHAADGSCCGHDHGADAAEDPASAAARAALLAEEAASAEAFKPWVCGKCGVELPDSDAALLGDCPLVRSASTRIENWAYRSARMYDPRQEGDRLQDLLVVLGPYHWAVHAAAVSQTEYMRMVVGHVTGLMRQPGGAKPEHMRALRDAAATVSNNLRRTYEWLTTVGHMAPGLAAHTMMESLTLGGSELLQGASHLAMTPRLRASEAALAASMQQAGATLIAAAAPALNCLRGWSLDAPHPLVYAADGARALAAAAAAAAPRGAAAKDGGLSVAELKDFLPAAAAEGKGAGKGAGKKKGKK
ncbi:hypothetical protein HT031_001660 [Scenedesmus sp. PABB004]|nr:hypothetical protein HT031_001660 [Scenedesmus sp. PABB004]